MEKINFNIALKNGKFKEVEGYYLNYKGLEIGIHKAFDNLFWTATELRTGISLFTKDNFKMTKESAIIDTKHTIDKYRNVILEKIERHLEEVNA